MGGLNPFDSGTFTVEERAGGRQLPIITGVTHRIYFERLGNNLEAFALGSLGIEMVDLFALERDPEGGLYLPELLEMLKNIDSISEHGIGNSTFIAIGSKFIAKILTISGFSDFDVGIDNASEVKDWLRGNKSLLPLPPEGDLKALFSELVHSVELVKGSKLRVRPTLERFLGLSHSAQ